MEQRDTLGYCGQPVALQPTDSELATAFARLSRWHLLQHILFMSYTQTHWLHLLCSCLDSLLNTMSSWKTEVAFWDLNIIFFPFSIPNLAELKKSAGRQVQYPYQCQRYLHHKLQNSSSVYTIFLHRAASNLMSRKVQDKYKFLNWFITMVLIVVFKCMHFNWKYKFVEWCGCLEHGGVHTASSDLSHVTTRKVVRINITQQKIPVG